MTQRFRKQNEVFLKVPMILIILFFENNVLGTIYIDRYRFWGLGGYMVHLTFFSLLFLKMEKLQELHLY